LKTRLSRLLPFGVAAAALTACAGLSNDEPPATVRAETVFAVTDSGALIRFNAGTPRQLASRQPITGLAPGETLVGIDFRVARGELYGLTSTGRLVVIDTASARARAVGSAPPAGLSGTRFGFDFNPAADRVRVVSDSGQNLRLHPDTGAVAATDAALAGPPGEAARITAAAYTYNKRNDKLTTNYALDIGRGRLVTQGSIEGSEPVVSPNTGRIADVGPLGTGPVDDAAFDIADIDNAALAALRQGGRTRLFAIDLASGKASLLGTVGHGEALRGMAIQP
jgi:DNA-binding beta-propeller fold protein YncE